MRYRFTKDDVTVRRNDNGSLTLSIVLDGHLKHMNYMMYSEREALKKFQHEFGTYPDDYKPAGVLPLCNFGGMAIMEIKGDYVYVCDNYGDGYKNITKNLIQYTKYGKPFFRRNAQVWYLSDFMKVA